MRRDGPISEVRVPGFVLGIENETETDPRVTWTWGDSEWGDFAITAGLDPYGENVRIAGKPTPRGETVEADPQ